MIEHTEDAWIQERLLRALRSAPDLLPAALLIRLAASPAPRVVYAAIQQLAGLADPDVRALAWRLLADEPPDLDGVRLLSANYRVGDGLAVFDRLPADGTPDELHGVGLALLTGLAGEDRVTDVVGPLQWVYETTPCSVCRRDAVEALARHGALDEARARECCCDCDPDTRELGRAAVGRASSPETSPSQ